jgi:putative GTP pyrophosphokinase
VSEHSCRLVCQNPSVNEIDDLAELRTQLTRFMMSYKFGLDEVTTKINILKEEFTRIHDYSPIEHVGSRLKSPESILKKAIRKGAALDLEGIRSDVLDIAGIRVTCSFISDTYKIRDMLAQQQDLTVIREVDYIANPKPNGYKSLHLVVEVPVFMSDRVEQVRVEVQIRTIAMDFWASLEHKIYYKYDREVPERLLDDLRQAAEVANRLDVEMERLHDEVRTLNGDSPGATQSEGHGVSENVLRAFLGMPKLD